MKREEKRTKAAEVRAEVAEKRITELESSAGAEKVSPKTID